MENNEDNRQMTVISEAISLIEDYTDIYCTNEGSSFQYMTPEGVKHMLESLLPKEENNLIKARIGGACDPLLTERSIPEMESIAKLWFDATFKPYNK